jgi:AcrR family transcriptional regulator
MGRPAIKRTAIERSSLELFVEKGIDGTSIRDIAQRAGVTEGALYRHHKSKDDLARFLFEQAFATLDEPIHDVLTDDVPSETRVRDLVRELYGLLSRDSFHFHYAFHTNHILLEELRVGDRSLPNVLRRAAKDLVRNDLTLVLACGAILQYALAFRKGQISTSPAVAADQVSHAVIRLLREG